MLPQILTFEFLLYVQVKMEQHLENVLNFHSMLKVHTDWLSNAEKILMSFKHPSKLVDHILNQIHSHRVCVISSLFWHLCLMCLMCMSVCMSACMSVCFWEILIIATNVLYFSEQKTIVFIHINFKSLAFGTNVHYLEFLLCNHFTTTVFGFWAKLISSWFSFMDECKGVTKVLCENCGFLTLICSQTS